MDNDILTAADLAEVTAFRHALHRMPEVSGDEQRTAAAVVAALPGPDQLVTGLGGHGVAAIYQGAASGPTVMLRAELDALPIRDLSGAGHASLIPGVGHQCGHDGHTAILMGVARHLSRVRPARGRVVLMFQPAEETGAGAAGVIDDPRFEAIRPDWAFAIHNMPGVPLGVAELPVGPASCASCGVRVAFTGKTSHAAQPELAQSPARAIAGLVPALLALGPGGEPWAAPQPGFRLVTVSHLTMGAPAFGITPGAGEIWLTVRALLDADLEDLLQEVAALAGQAARAEGLGVEITWHEHFAAGANDAEAAARLRRAMEAAGIEVRPGTPMRPSEDFGRFGAAAPLALAFLGAGQDCPPLHAEAYDFPDALIAPGVRLFAALVAELLG
jgi:amidohydrolase